MRDGLLDGIRIDHPDGLANPTALRRASARGRDRARLGREDPRARRAAARLAGRGHDRLRVRERRHGALREPGRRGAVHRALRRAHRRGSAASRRSRSRRSSSRPQTTFEPEVEWLRAPARRTSRTSSTSPARSPRFRVYRTYVDPDTRRGRRPRPPGGHRGPPARPPRVDPAARGARPRRLRAPLPADDAAGDGEGRRGHGLLPLQPPALPERGRRRPRPLLARGRRLPRREPRARAALPAPAARDADARHEAERRRPRPHRGAHVARRRSGASTCSSGAASTPRCAATARPTPNEEYLIYQTLVGAWPLPAGAAASSTCEKALREAKTQHELDRAERGVGAAASPASRTALYDHRPFLDTLRAVRRSASRSSASRIALAQTLLKLTCPGVPDIYQGDELVSLNLVDPDNRRPVDWELRRRLLGELAAGAPPTPETAKLLPDLEDARAARAAPGGLRRRLRAARRRRRHLRLHPRRRRARRRPDAAGCAVRAAGRLPRRARRRRARRLAARAATDQRASTRRGRALGRGRRQAAVGDDQRLDRLRGLGRQDRVAAGRDDRVVALLSLSAAIESARMAEADTLPGTRIANSSPRGR